MTLVSPRLGDFIWYELRTAQPAAAPSFYAHVIGSWSSRPMEGFDDYTLFVTEQGPLGGAARLSARAAQMGVSPHWMSSVYVGDVDAAASQVTQTGGRVLVEPAEHPNLGRLALAADPFGAVFGVCTPARAMPVHDSSKPGEVCWHELISEDHDAALAFYARLFGWKKRSEFDMGTMGKYVVYGNEIRDLGGIFTMPKQQHPSAWNYYFQVADLDAAVERAKAKGATLLNGPMQVPSGARIAQLSDPQGAGFSLHENPKS